jgi:hypothetical protein
MKQLHTDDIYRDRWQEYTLADGRVFDSRQVNWRLVEWEKVVQIVTYLRDKKYLTHCKNPGFRFFVIYRWAGRTWENGKPRQIREWAVGWSDGERCFMTDLDFKLGHVTRQYVVPVSQVRKHIHPRLEGRYATAAGI